MLHGHGVGIRYQTAPDRSNLQCKNLSMIGAKVNCDHPASRAIALSVITPIAARVNPDHGETSEIAPQ